MKEISLGFLKKLIVGLFIIMVNLLGILSFAWAVTLEVSPASYNTSTGNIFTIKIMITNHSTPEDITAGQFNLSFNPYVLQVTDNTGTPITTLTASNNFPFILQNMVDNDSGIISYAAGNITVYQTAPVELVSITFKAILGGTSPLTLDSSQVATISEGTLIAEEISGEVQVSGPGADDTTSPTSQVSPLSIYQKNSTFGVKWSGVDNEDGSGIKCYHIQYKIKDIAGNLIRDWTDWDLNDDPAKITTTATSATFTGENNYTYYFQSRAQDNAGNWEAFPGGDGDTFTTVDTESPTVDVNSPTEGEYVHQTVTITPVISDNVKINKVVFYVDGYYKATDTSPPYEYDWDTTQHADANHYVKVAAYDGAGNRSEDTHLVKVDNQPPTSEVDPLPEMLSQVSFTVSWGGEDNVEISLYDVQYNVKLATSQAIISDWTDWQKETVITSDSFSGEDGRIYCFRSRARDKVGNWEDYEAEGDTCTTIDLSAPYVEIINPEEGAAIAGTILVSANATDNVGVSKVEFYIDEQLVQTLTSSPYEYNWDTVGATDGEHKLKVVAYDADNKQGSDTHTVIVDNQIPSSKVKDLPSITNTASFTVSWDGEDLPSGVAIFDVQFRDGEDGVWTDWLIETTEKSLNFGENNQPVEVQENHTYYFRCRAKDKAGNLEPYPEVPDTQTTINFSLPMISIINPEDEKFVAGEVKIQTEVSDNAVKVAFYINDVQNAVDEESPFEYIWNTKFSPDGTYTLYARAYTAQEKYTDSKEITVYVDNTKPTAEISPLSEVQNSTTFVVQWSGDDGTSGSGIKNFDVQYKEENGDWIDWKLQTTETKGNFNGKNLYTYYFRVRAYDVMGNQGNFSQAVGTKIDAYEIDIIPTTNNQILIQISGTNLSSVPYVTVTQNGAPSEVISVSLVPDTTYTYEGSYDLKLYYDGPAVLAINGDEATAEFITATIHYNELNIINSEDGKLQLVLPSGSTSVDKTMAITLTPHSNNAGRLKNGELVGIGNVYRCGPTDLSFNLPVSLKITYKDNELQGYSEDKLGIYILNNQGWNYLPTLRDADYNRLQTQISGLNNIAIFADIVAPAITNVTPEAGSTIDTTKPEIKATLSDGGSGIDESSIVLKLDGDKVHYDFDGDYLTYTPPQPLSGGKHTLEITLSDNSGNTTTKAQEFNTLEEELNISYLHNYPNPASGKTTFVYRLGKTSGVTVKIEIYNLAGKLITTIAGETDGSTDYEVSKLSNGIYIYRVVATDGKKTVSAINKLAIVKE